MVSSVASMACRSPSWRSTRRDIEERFFPGRIHNAFRSWPSAPADCDERLKKEFPLITLPLLILHGTADKATKPSGSQRFFDMAGSIDKTLKLYEGHFHDLLNDVGKEQVMADIENWIDTHLSAAIETKARTQ